MHPLIRLMLLASPNKPATWREVAVTIVLGVAVFSAMLAVFIGVLSLVQVAGLS